MASFLDKVPKRGRVLVHKGRLTDDLLEYHLVKVVEEGGELVREELAEHEDDEIGEELFVLNKEIGTQSREKLGPLKVLRHGFVGDLRGRILYGKIGG